jgi:outer membrane protein assembly factor BamB
VHWSERLEGEFSASPVSAEGRVYFQNEEGGGFVVRASTSFELLAENDLGERSLASYAVTDGALLIRTEKHLWKIAAK